MKFLALILFIPYLAVSQLAKGDYDHKDRETMTQYRLQILDSSKFIKSSTIFLGHGSYLEKGNYIENGDTIILNFKPYNQPKSFLKIISKDTIKFDKWVKLDPSKRISLSISLYENENIPLQSLASLVDLISKNTIVGTLSIDEKGEFQFYSAENIIDELRIRSLGFKALNISLSDFNGFTSQINAYLIPEGHDEYRETEGEAKYLLSKNGKHLQFINNDGTLGVKYTRLKNN